MEHRWIACSLVRSRSLSRQLRRGSQTESKEANLTALLLSLRGVALRSLETFEPLRQAGGKFIFFARHQISQPWCGSPHEINHPEIVSHFLSPGGACFVAHIRNGLQTASVPAAVIKNSRPPFGIWIANDHSYLRTDPICLRLLDDRKRSGSFHSRFALPKCGTLSV
jgi:hypothetical protein